MASLAQIEANRRNSQKSTGPCTEAGKLKCSQNAFKSGIYAEAPLVTGENPDELDDLARAYRDTWRPAHPDEEALVETLIHTDWLTRRMRRVETQYWNRRTDGLHDNSYYEGDPAYELAATYGGIQEELDRIQRRLSSLERIYRRTLVELRRLRAERPQSPDVTPKPITPAPAIGFVPSEPAPATPAAQTRIGFVPSKRNAPLPPRRPHALDPRSPGPLFPPRATLTPEEPAE
jgi:hypothetical protein